jgi:hypothetical protein
MYTFLVTLSSVIVLSDHYCLSLSATIPISPELGPHVLVPPSTVIITFALITFKEDTANDFIRLAAHLTNTLFIARQSPADETDDAKPVSDRLQCDYYYYYYYYYY